MIFTRCQTNTSMVGCLRINNGIQSTKMWLYFSIVFINVKYIGIENSCTQRLCDSNVSIKHFDWLQHLIQLHYSMFDAIAPQKSASGYCYLFGCIDILSVVYCGKVLTLFIQQWTIRNVNGYSKLPQSCNQQRISISEVTCLNCNHRRRALLLILQLANC